MADARPNTPKIVAENLYKIFGSEPERAFGLLEAGRTKAEILEETGLTVAVRDIGFSVASGEIFVVMGLSGSGKSTLVRMLNRLIEPTRGKVSIDGEVVSGADPEALRQLRLNRLTMVFQHFALFPHKTVVENVEYGLKVRGTPSEERRQRALRALEQVGLSGWADHPPQALSGGMQQRVGLARALATEAEIMLMDEPFSALDPLIRRDMQKELLALQETLHRTIVFITHDLHEALILGDRVAIMKDGRFVQVGTPQEIVASPADDYVEAFTQDVDRGRVFTAATVMEDAEALVLASTTPQAALERMERSRRDGLFLLEDGRIAGVVSYRELALAGRGGQDRIGSVLRRDYPRTRPDVQLEQVYRQCSSGLPIAVIGADDELLGVIDPLRVFATLSGDFEKTEPTGGRGEGVAAAAHG